MADPLLPIITDAGIAAAFAADELGTHISIHEVALGDVGWTPDSTATALQSEQVRADIAGGSNPAPNQVHLATLFDGPEEFWIREIGFYLEDDTLFAVWSHATEVIGYKSTLADFLLTLDLVLSVIPPGSVTIETTEDALSVGNAADIAAVVARVDLIEPVAQREHRPIAPNLLPDSKKFTALCGGALNTILAWDAGGLDAPWSGAWIGSADGTLTVEVVAAHDQTRLTALGLWPLGDLSALVGPLPGAADDDDFGVDVHIAVFTVNVTTAIGAADAEGFFPIFDFVHSQSSHTSWFRGLFSVQASAFINVLACDPDISFRLFRHSFTLGGDENDVGLGWQHITERRDGVGGYITSNIYGVDENATGAITFALALPYMGLGWHHGLPIWAAYIGEFASDDTV